MAEIENLSIVLSANAQAAIAEIDKLASALGKFSTASRNAGGAAKQTGDEVKDMGTATAKAADETGRVEKNTNSFTDGLKRIGDAAKQSGSKLGEFVSSLKRIAYYRMIRSIIKGITQSLKEGVTNLYEWSSAHGGHFASTMDSLSESVKYLKNALGTLAAPLIESVAPAINTIIDALVDMINAFNMAIAALNGQDTYTVAVRGSKAYANELEKAAENAAKTKKEIKETILGFDEINKLQAVTTGGGGGSSGGGGSGEAAAAVGSPLRSARLRAYGEPYPTSRTVCLNGCAGC
jgi:methyl-accepting chemotaxis protein